MDPELGVLTPMAGEYIINGSYLKKNGYHLFRDVEGSPVQASLEEEQYIRKRSEVELEFESGRREVSPDSVSKLECIFVAKSMENIKRMLSRGSQLVILEVEIIEALNCSRVDSHWFEEYFEVQDYAFIENYWSGLQYNDGIDTWEYLIDGAIKVKNQDDAKQALNSNSDVCCFEEELLIKIVFFSLQNGLNQIGNIIFKPLLLSHNLKLKIIELRPQFLVSIAKTNFKARI